MKQKNIKRLLLGCGVLCACLLTGCGSQNDEKSAPKEDKTEQKQDERTKRIGRDVYIPDKKVSKRPYRATLTTIGDSISEGWLPHGYYDTPYGQYTSDLLRMNFAQSACQGNAFLPNKRYSHNNFTDLIQYHEDNLKKSNVIVIFEGTNDYGFNTNLKQVTQQMDENLKTIKEINPNAYILGILPMNRWDKSSDKSAYDLKNKAGYTLKELCDEEARVYRENNIAYTTFQDMGMNLTKDKTIDGVHPLPTTQKEMGQALANHFSKVVMTQYEKPYTAEVTLKQKAPVWGDLSFTYTKALGQKGDTFRADKQYHHLNGHTYYSVYKKDTWMGYVTDSDITIKEMPKDKPSEDKAPIL